MKDTNARSTDEAIGALDEEFDVVDLAIDEPAENAVTISIHRPDARNALNGAVREALTECIELIDASDDVAVVILTGSDDGKAFVAGADITELRERGMLEQRPHSQPPRIYERIAQSATPIVARINGHALGGGLELAVACDIRVAHECAILGSPEINLGIIPGGGATQRLPRLIGEGQAMRLILTGALIDAEEANEIGLVDFVASDDEFDDIIHNLISDITSKSPLAVEYAKQAVRSASQLSLSDGLEYEAQLFTQLFATADKNEGIDAFLEGREANWKGE